MIPNKKTRKTNGIAYAELGSLVPPHSIDAEQAVLAACMIDKIAITKVIEILEPEGFYNEVHKIVYQAMINLFQANSSIDIVTLAQQLRVMEKLDFVGGTYYLAELNTKSPTSANVELHALIVQENSFKRELIQSCGQILENSYEPKTDALDVIDEAGKLIFRIAEKRFSKSFVSIKKLADSTKELILNFANKTGDTGVLSGFNDLDRITNGFQNSDLIIIAARPSMGKTALALNIASHIALKENKAVAFFSLEMEARQLMLRLISSETGINTNKMKEGKLNQHELKQVLDFNKIIGSSKLIIDDSANMSILELRAKCRRLKAEHKISIIIIDYLQILQPPKAESREREISIISRNLKQIAKELEIPVIALAQLNRSVESRADKKPMLSDLRESGSIEQDADVVMFINRPEIYGITQYEDKTPTAGTAEIIVGKQRNGDTGIVRMSFIPHLTKFGDLYRGSAIYTPHFADTEKDEEPF